MSKEAKHTPGPWFVEGRTVYALNGMETNQFSAGIQGGFTDSGRTSDGELDANARLIAAAPELLNACQKALPFLMGLRDGLQDLYPDRDPSLYEQQAINLIEHAVASATGGDHAQAA